MCLQSKHRYCRDNPNLFKNADTAYVLAYAVIMLNTDAHNPMVTKKMTKSDFVRMNTSSDVEEQASQVELLFRGFIFLKYILGFWMISGISMRY